MKKKKIISLISSILCSIALCGLFVLSSLVHNKAQETSADSSVVIDTYTTAYNSHVVYDGTTNFTNGTVSVTTSDNILFYDYSASLYKNFVGDLVNYNFVFTFNSLKIWNSDYSKSVTFLSSENQSYVVSTNNFSIIDFTKPFSLYLRQVDIGGKNIYFSLVNGTLPLDYYLIQASFGFKADTSYYPFDTIEYYNCDYNYVRDNFNCLGGNPGGFNNLVPYLTFCESMEFSNVLDDYANGYNVGYSAGYNSGSNDGYNSGYSIGHDIGYNEGVASQQQAINDAYNNGYNVGYSAGLTSDATAITIFTGILNVALVPINFFLACFNFEILGINLASFIKSILTVLLVIIVIKMVLGSTNSGE